MPLKKHDGVVCEDSRFGIGFTMRDGEKQVVAWVEKGALLILQDREPGSGERKIFDRGRETLEAIASANFDAGIVELNGSMIIRRFDMEGLV